MNKREEMLPVDLGHLEDKAKLIVSYFEAYRDEDRSEEYRNYMLSKAESLASTLVKDFAYMFDTKTIGGIVPYGLEKL